LSEAIGDERHERRFQQTLSESLVQLLPMSALIRQGAFLPVPTVERFAPGQAPYPPASARHPDQGAIVQDPLLRALLLESGLSELQLQETYSSEELLRSAEEGGWLPGAQDLFEQLAIVLGIDTREVLAASAYTRICNELGASPMASTSVVANHMLASTVLVLQPDLSVGEAQMLVREYISSDAVLRFPRLEDISLAEISHLRSNSELFDSVRTALCNLELAVSEMSTGSSFSQLSTNVRDAASDIVGPTYRRVSTELTKDNTVSFLVKSAAAGFVSLALSGVAYFFPPVAKIAPTAGFATSRLVGKIGARERRQLNTASRILVSVLPADSRL
jgi:hypothetical protein